MERGEGSRGRKEEGGRDPGTQHVCTSNWPTCHVYLCYLHMYMTLYILYIHTNKHTKGLEISLAHSMTYDQSDLGQHRRIQVCEDGRALVGLLTVWRQTVLGGGNHVALAARGEREGGREGGR